jgi:TonB family protein
MKFFLARQSLPGRRQALALALSLVLHGLALVAVQQHRAERLPPPVPAEDEVMVLEVAPVPAKPARPEPLARAPSLAAAPGLAVAPTPDREPAFMAAPPAPTAQEWALASTYKLKNSKRYRYTWGQQVRSMMGTAYEGVDQGLVRFRIEIAPDGRLTRLETLWSTSETAERLARQAVQAMPPLPPTPTGRPLIFEQTISFQPFDAGGPPIYKNDCLPDPPAFRNPFAWDGRSAPTRADPAPQAALDPQELEECLKSLPEDSIEAESAHDRRQLEQWGSGRLAR